MLELAEDPNLFLLERLNFLSIVASNLDEFFMVRVASLKDQVLADFTKRDIAGLTAAEREVLSCMAIFPEKINLEELEYLLQHMNVWNFWSVSRVSRTTS